MWIPKIIETKTSIALFWDGEKYLNVNTEKLMKDLDEEIDNYYLGGEDDISNLEEIDMEVYWSITGQLNNHC